MNEMIENVYFSPLQQDFSLGADDDHRHRIWFCSVAIDFVLYNLVAL